MKIKDPKGAAVDFLLLSAATVIASCGVFFFLVPSHLALGSVAGAAIVLANFLPLQISTLTLILNVGLLALGFVLIGRDFGTKTVFTTVAMPLVLAALERLFPNMTSLTGDPMADMLCFLFVVSFAQSIMFKRNASSGGLDIVGKLMNKYFHMDMGRAISLVGMAIALSSALVYDSKTVVLSVLGTYLSGIVLDHFIFNSTLKKRVCILSEKREEIVRYITEELHSGATVYEAKGAYTDEPRLEVITIVNMQEYRRLMDHIATTDPQAFVTVYNVSEAVYRPKKLN
ncbi:MAG: YitT family protein [Oscillospiraceae bacterium]|nr:YitT family protein [Oscillospiraceae bacterium]